MIREFEGKTEKEAIDRAIAELNLNREEFDVEIVGAQKKGKLFRKGPVRIRVHLGEDDEQIEGSYDESRFPDEKSGNLGVANGGYPADGDIPRVVLEPESKSEEEIITFLGGLIERMGYSGDVTINRREEQKIFLSIESENSSILIGRKGKNLDALQFLTNVYSARIESNLKVIVDAENYRVRREQKLVHLAQRTAEQVRRSRGSRLLEPMNPFERRLIHTTLNQLEDIDTQSEGDGLYKQVRVIYRGTFD